MIMNILYINYNAYNVNDAHWPIEASTAHDWTRKLATANISHVSCTHK